VGSAGFRNAAVDNRSSNREDKTPMTESITDGARMVAACTIGDEATVRELLRETPSLASQVLAGSFAPLHYAVRERHRKP
jgi:hypothetical protein